MPPRSPRLPGAGDVVAGKYRLERMLKQGGMGAVWIATHLGLDERVALKFMDPRRVSSPEARMRFTREAKAAAQVRSTNIVQILDHGVDNHVPYIAMELLSGEDLGGRLRRAGKLSMNEASSLLDDLAHALDRAHAAGIVHRDLKPENIFLAKDGDQEVPKILDFGIALEIQPDASDDSATTQEGVILGTPYFMSPEQVRGRANIDHRSDLWSLGVILFRAITGIRPFGRGATADVIVQICSDPIPRASVVAPDLPEEVDRFFEKALARDADKRFSSAREMADAFGEIAKIADAADKTQPDPIGMQISRAPSARAPRKGPPPLPGSESAKSESMPPRMSQQSTGPEATRASGILAKGAGTGGEAADASGALNQASQTFPAAAPGSAASEPVAAQTPLPTQIAPAATTSATREAAAAGTANDVAPAMRPAAAAGGDTSKASERRPVPSVRPSRNNDARSRTWLAFVGALAVAALVLVGFRDKIFPPPPRDQSGATIVLTAGTVVLVGPGGRMPVSAPSQAESAGPSAPSAASSVAPAASSTTAAPASASATGAVTTAATTAATAPSVATTTATTASPPKATSVAPGASSPPDPEPKPKVEAKPVETKPPTPPTPPKKEDPDLGY